MGCDIHAHVEVKVKGRWHHYHHPNIGRDYGLFDRMAGVRGDGKQKIAAPRGLPKDATFLTKFEAKRFGEDGHSHSWLTAKEVDELGKWWEEREQARHSIGEDNGRTSFEWDVVGYIFGNGWGDLDDQGEDKDVSDARLVFWFDN